MDKVFNKKIAFTMAEILITLMIIGTIAAITIPSLRKYATEEEHVARAKKAYASISNATKLIETQHGEIKRWGKLTGSANGSGGSGSSGSSGSDSEETTPNGINKALKYYSERFNIVKTCQNGASGCWTQTKGLDGSSYGSANSIKGGSIAFQTADGMTWNIFGETTTTGYGVNSGETDSLIVFVDTNGEKKPNTLGLDVFAFVINPERGTLPAGSDNNSADCTSTSSKGTDCAAKIIKEGKITYDTD